jgi:hypothetical protein
MCRGAGAKDGCIYCTQTARSVAGRRVWDKHEQWVDITAMPVARRHEECIRNGAEAAARNDRYRLDGAVTVEQWLLRRKKLESVGAMVGVPVLAGLAGYDTCKDTTPDGMHMIENCLGGKTGLIVLLKGQNQVKVKKPKTLKQGAKESDASYAAKVQEQQKTYKRKLREAAAINAVRLLWKLSPAALKELDRRYGSIRAQVSCESLLLVILLSSHCCA